MAILLITDNSSYCFLVLLFRFGAVLFLGMCFVGQKAYYFKSSVAPRGKLNNKIALAPVEESFLNQQLALLK